MRFNRGYQEKGAIQIHLSIYILQGVYNWCTLSYCGGCDARKYAENPHVVTHSRVDCQLQFRVSIQNKAPLDCGKYHINHYRGMQ